MPAQIKSNRQKAALRAQHFSKPHLTLSELAKWFKDKYNEPISQSTVSRVLSSRFAHLDDPQYNPNQTRRPTLRWPELEASLDEWLQQAEGRITQEVIREKARQLWVSLYPGQEMPQFSNGWLHRFQSRRKVSCKPFLALPGGRSESPESVMMRIRQALKKYEPNDIFNCDETGLNWRLFPDRSPTTRETPDLNRSKARITAHFCCNSDGSERLPIWFIGTTEKPRAFSAAGINIENLSCVWRYNKKAWMTDTIFEEWLVWFDKRMAGRKVVLLMDNFSAHKIAVDIYVQLQNTLIIWLPGHTDTNPRYQPLCQGIVHHWKALWKQQWVSYMVDEFDRGFDPMLTMTVLRAIRWAIMVWNLDVPSDTISKCFTKALSAEDTERINTPEAFKEIKQGLHHLQLTRNIADPMDFHEFFAPVEEQVDDHLKPDDIIELPEDDNDSYQTLPIISIAEALESLQKLRLYEEQQLEGNTELIQMLTCYERILIQRKAERQRQTDIRMYYG